MSDCWFGIKVNPMPTLHESTMFAEIFPAASLKLPRIYRDSRGKFRITRRGRKWTRFSHRWWFEIHEEENSDGTCTHWYKNDGGAMTLRGAVSKATTEIDDIVYAEHHEVYGDPDYAFVPAGDGLVRMVKVEDLPVVVMNSTIARGLVDKNG